MAESDLAIDKQVDNPTPPVGSNVTFTVTASNLGPADDTGVVVNDVLPVGYGFVSATPTAGIITASPPPGGNGLITWSIGNLLTIDTPQLIIVATVLAPPNDYLNTAVISGDNDDPNEENNASSASVTPAPALESDLAITKMVDNMIPVVGTNVTFTITAFNNGPNDDTGVVVTDILPSGYAFVSVTSPSPPFGSITSTPAPGASGVIIWNIGNFPNGSISVITITATVLSPPNDYQNIATITGDNDDPILENNTDTAEVFPISKGNCETVVSIVVQSDFPWASGTTLQYFIGVTPITGLIDVSGDTSVADVQSDIDADPTYIASGTTITIVSFDSNTLTLTSVIEKSSTKQIAADGSVTWTHGGFIVSDSEPFICNLNPVRPRSTGGGVAGFAFPETVCVARNRDGRGKLIECEPYVFYPSKYGRKYELYYQDETKCCYKLKN